MIVFDMDLYEYFHLSKKTEKGILHTYFHEDDTERIAVLVIPGGAYAGLCFRENKPIAERLYREGFNVCYLDYTCGEDAKYPISLKEGGMSVIFMREWFIKQGREQPKLLVMGFSAGGHLAGQISNPCEEKDACSFLSEGQKELWRVDGTVYGYPVVSTKAEYIHEASFQNLLKEEYEAKKTKVSLEELINGASAPAFIFHCADDPVVPIGNSLVLAAAYGKGNVPFELHVFPKGGHGVALPTEECWLKAEMGMVNPDLIVWWELFRKWADKLV